jgi:hypothetical protein
LPDAAAPTASHPNVRDNGQRPYGDETAADVEVNWEGNELKYFSQQGRAPKSLAASANEPRYIRLTKG